MSVPLKFFEISRLVKICRKILILVTVFENLDFCQNVLKSSRFLSKFLIISYLVQISDHFDFVLFEKSRFPWNFSKNLDFDQNCSKSRFWSTFIENLHLCQFSENLDFGQDFRNISILVEMLKNLKFGQIFGKISTLEKISIVVRIFGNLHFGQNFRETSDEWKFWKSRLSSKYSKIWILDKIFVNRHFGKKKISL